MMPTSVRRSASRAVSKTTWIDHNRAYLDELYDTIREANRVTGRWVLDSLTRESWYALAYANSTIYSTEDAWMYRREERDAEYYDG